MPRAVVGVSLKMYFDHVQTLQWCGQVSALATEHPAIVSGAAELVVPKLPADDEPSRREGAQEADEDCS